MLIDPSWLHKQVRTALAALYNPPALREHPLLAVFELAGQANPALALQRLMLTAIESMQPERNAPANTRAWRLYQVLRRRHVEQLPQAQVAADLGLSVRQLQREESLAREELANYLWNQYHLAERTSRLHIEAMFVESPGPTADEELAHLRQHAPLEVIHPGRLISEVLDIILPLAESAQVSLLFESTEDAPSIAVQTQLVKQGLLELLEVAIHRTAPGEIGLTVAPSDISTHVRLRIQSQTRRSKDQVEADDTDAEKLGSAAQLIELCGGRIDRQEQALGVWSADILLPMADQAMVLVIDDNMDTRQLLRRYLAGSRYRFAEADNAQNGLSLARELEPRVIVLDVMMPEQDGWTLLGQLRAHPDTAGIPIIICTILPQEELALALGAAEFLRKPVNRAQLLSALDRQIAH